MGWKEESTWFITGCSKGLGRAIAEHVLAKGNRCVITARRLEEIQPICEKYPSTALALSLDVTDPKQVTSAVGHAEAKFGAIDVLVNNAGFGYNSSIEEGEDATIRAMFEANVFGLAALVRAVLPGMRSRGRGHIFNMSSVGGRVASPGTAYYAATKFAVEALSQGLAKEIEPLGIGVTAIEPGPFRTAFLAASINASGTAISDYTDTVGARHRALRESHGKQPGDPERAAQAIYQAFQMDRPPSQLILGNQAYQRVHAELARQTEELEKLRELSLSADFPVQKAP